MTTWLLSGVIWRKPMANCSESRTSRGSRSAFTGESLSPRLFRPDLVTREVFDFFAFRAANARVKLQVTVNTEQNAFGNAGELRQVISNLLANSLDACKSGDAICVRVSAARSARQVAGVRIVVADTGCGINKKNLKAVFEPFFTTKKDTGTGLGLWVSRELIEKHGGRLTVRSSDRGGAHGNSVLYISADCSRPFG